MLNEKSILAHIFAKNCPMTMFYVVYYHIYLFAPLTLIFVQNKMAKRNQKATKPRSQRPKKHISHQEADMDTSETHVPIQKSKRIINSKLDSIKLCAEVTTVSQEDVNNEKRPIRQQIIELPIELNCADMSRETVHRLEIKSCSNCDNFRLDQPFMRSGSTQENVCKQRYGCTRKRE